MPPPSPKSTFILIIFSDECEDFLFSDSAILRREVSPLGGVYLSFELNWGGMPSPRLIVIDLLKTAKRGFLGFKISVDYLNILISIVRINFV